MAGAARDQAAGLRRMLAPGRVRVLALDAGAQGDGKTTAALGLARAAGALGRRVVVLDQSAGDVAAALSLTWRWELAHLLSGEREWREVVLPGPDGIGVVPGAKGLAALAQSGGDGAALFGGFARLSAPPDLVLLHLAARGARAAAGLLPPEAELLIVARTARASVTAAYARIKEHVRRSGRRQFRLLVNRAGEAEARALHATMAEVARRFLGAALRWGGTVPAGAVPGDARWGSLAQSLDGWALAEYSA